MALLMSSVERQLIILQQKSSCPSDLFIFPLFMSPWRPAVITKNCLDNQSHDSWMLTRVYRAPHHENLILLEILSGNSCFLISTYLIRKYAVDIVACKQKYRPKRQLETKVIVNNRSSNSEETLIIFLTQLSLKIVSIQLLLEDGTID